MTRSQQQDVLTSLHRSLDKPDDARLSDAELAAELFLLAVLLHRHRSLVHILDGKRGRDVVLVRDLSAELHPAVVLEVR